jgi:DNA repair exonuclease SbcCD nuclease subunit
VHPKVRVFDHPRTFDVNVRGTPIALSGFPYERRDVRVGFTGLLDQTEWKHSSARVRLLCIHHCVEGATVGPADFTFRTASDVIRAREVPGSFSAALSGHIHRHQVLTTGLDGRGLQTPIFYPGSIERTSFAEMGEPKGFIVLTIRESEGDTDVRWEFRPLPARPMVQAEVSAEGIDVPALDSAIQSIVANAPNDAVLSIRVAGSLTDAHWRALSSRRLREFVPETMNLEIAPTMRFDAPRQHRTRTPVVEESEQHAFF